MKLSKWLTILWVTPVALGLISLLCVMELVGQVQKQPPAPQRDRPTRASEAQRLEAAGEYDRLKSMAGGEERSRRIERSFDRLAVRSPFSAILSTLRSPVEARVQSGTAELRRQFEAENPEHASANIQFNFEEFQRRNPLPQPKGQTAADTTAYQKELGIWMKKMSEAARHVNPSPLMIGNREAAFQEWLQNRIVTLRAQRNSADAFVQAWFVRNAAAAMSTVTRRETFVEWIDAIERSSWTERERWEAAAYVCTIAMVPAHEPARICRAAIRLGRMNGVAQPMELAAVMHRGLETGMFGASAMSDSAMQDYRVYAMQVLEEIERLVRGEAAHSPIDRGAALAEAARTAHNLHLILSARSLLEEADRLYASAESGREERGQIATILTDLPKDEYNKVLAAQQVSLNEAGRKAGLTGSLKAFEVIGAMLAEKDSSPQVPTAFTGVSKYEGAAFLLDATSTDLRRNYTVDERIDALYSEVPALVSYVRQDCPSGPCLPAAYGLLLRLKGLLASSLSPRTPPSPIEANEAYLLAMEQLRELTSGGAAVSERESSKQEGARIAKALLGAERDHDGNPPRPKLAAGKALRPAEAFVDLYYYLDLKQKERRGSYMAVISALRPGTTEIGTLQLIELGAAEELEALEQQWYEKALGKSDEGQAALNQIWDRVSQAVRAAIPTGIQRVIVSPDSRLAPLPWHLLETRLGLPVSTVVSWQQLASLRAAGAKPAASGPVLLVRKVEYAKDSGLDPLMADDGVQSAAAVVELPVVELSGARATKSSVLAGLTKVQYAHFQTHGVVYSKEDARALNRTFLWLAPGQASGGDAHLTSQQLAATDLRHLRLLSLAACHSADGEVLKGQGILGFHSAAAASGAQFTLLSLWQVREVEGSQLMTEFYKNLWVKKMNPPASLMEAIRAMQAANLPPYYWAGWMILGAE